MIERVSWHGSGHALFVWVSFTRQIDELMSLWEA